MLQTIDNKSVYVVEFDTMPEMPIHGLTSGEEMYENLIYMASYPHGPDKTLAGYLATRKRPTYAQALNDAIETGVITEPGKYGIYLVPGTYDYEVFEIQE